MGGGGGTWDDVLVLNIKPGSVFLINRLSLAGVERSRCIRTASDDTEEERLGKLAYTATG